MAGARSRMVRCLLVLGLGVGAWASPSAQAVGPDLAQYQRAERVLDQQLRGKVRNAAVAPRWLADGRFWYPRQQEDGRTTHILVDPATTTRTALFDDDMMHAALLAAGIADPGQVMQQVDRVAQSGHGLEITLRVDAQQAVVCTLPMPCEVQSLPVADPRDLPSPDGRHSVRVEQDNLWLRSGSEGARRALTMDGEPSHGYGVLPDFALRGIPRRAGKMQMPPFAVTWSPDSKRLFGVRYDERQVLPYPYLATAPTDGFRPVVHEVRLGLLGDAEQVRDAWFVTEADGSGTQHIAVPEGWYTLTEAGVLGWSAGADKVYAAIVRYDHPARLRLVEVDVRTGSVRTVREERSDTRVQLNSYPYNRPAVHVLQHGNGIVWFSQQDGWGHLYLIDRRDGHIIRQLTRGEWLVRDVVGVDEARGQVLFTAGGREPGDPYQRRLYRVALDGGTPVLLTPEAADHAIDAGAGLLMGGRPSHLLSPSAAYVVDSYSRVDQAPVSVLRSTTDGRVVLPLERADDRAVRAAGWVPPQRVTVLAADGRTGLQATVYLPPGYRDDGRHPVIDAMYGGPHITNAPVGFVDATATMNPVARSSLAQLGFVVVSIDARGTPGRSKAFHDASFLTAADLQLDDHVAAIRELAERYRGMDLTRVGIYGHSFGGYSAARALLRYPAFYTVGVASAGSHSFQGMYGGAIHGMDRLVGGQPVYADGTRVRPQPGAVPPLFQPLANDALADRLQGRLMLVYGDLDENAMPALTLQLARALTLANKDYDLLYLPNQDHELFRNDDYYMRRMWDYFVTHLMGATPPSYRIGAAASP